jgi:hypothetical protein
MLPRRAAVLLSLLVAVPGAAAAQSNLTVTADLLDRYLAAAAEANAIAAQNDAAHNAAMDPDALAAAEEEYEECAGEVQFAVMTAAERSRMQSYQQAMQQYANDLQNPRYAALVDSATAMMRAVEERAAPQVRERCGSTPEEAQEAELQALNEESSEWSWDQHVETAMGLGWEQYALLVEKIYLYLDTERPTPNDLWSAAELRVLGAYRDRLAAALNY